MATPGIAANAYAQIARITDPKSAGAGIGGVTENPEGKGFGAMLKDAMGSIADTSHKSDAQMQSAATGKANVLDVVTAVAETEVAIDALVAVRDKVVAAYEEIMRMPI
jgi:flagellar hook-basal body complex protein FliE